MQCLPPIVMFFSQTMHLSLCPKKPPPPPTPTPHPHDVTYDDPYLRLHTADVVCCNYQFVP